MQEASGVKFYKTEINTNNICDFYTLWQDWEQFVIGQRAFEAHAMCPHHVTMIGSEGDDGVMAWA